MRKQFIRLIGLIGLICLIPIASAQQISLGLQPPLIESLIKPGKSISVAYKLENNGDPSIMKATILPFRPKGDNGQIEIAKEFDGPIRFSLDNSDLALNKPFFMRPQESTQLLLKIRVPEGTPEGDYYYTLLITTEPPSLEAGNTGSAAQAGIGANIILSVSQTGFSTIDAKISLFSIVSNLTIPFTNKKLPLFDSNDQIPLKMIVHNKGQHVLHPDGEITLKGNFGEHATYSIVPQNILSQSQRLIMASGSASLNHTLTLWGFYIGKYSLSTNINFGDNTPNLYASTYFFAFPFKFGVVILIIAAIAWYLIRRLKNNH